MAQPDLAAPEAARGSSAAASFQPAKKPQTRHPHVPTDAVSKSNQVDDADSVSTASLSTISESSTVSFNISLWLLPPEDVRSHLQADIDEIAAMTGGPSFVPHATILGGIPCLCSSEEEADRWANELLATLNSELPAVGGIPCRFGRDQGHRPCCVLEDGKILKGNEGYEEDHVDADAEAVSVHPSPCVQWNQSAIAIMNRSKEFANAVELTHRAVCRTDESLLLPSQDETDSFDWTTTLHPPLCQPHLSLAYGNRPDLISARRGEGDIIAHDNDEGGYIAKVPPDFVSTEAMLIWTCSSLESVPTWREVGRVRLC